MTRVEMQWQRTMVSAMTPLGCRKDLGGCGQRIVGVARTQESCNTCGSKAEGKIEVLNSKSRWVGGQRKQDQPER